jgi:hypothetical protein
MITALFEYRYLSVEEVVIIERPPYIVKAGTHKKTANQALFQN